jgi:NADPH:quinone reductase
MKAVYIAEFSTDLRLELREIDTPQTARPSQVVVKVKAAGLNRADLLQSAGLYPPPKGVSPNIPGLEFSGEIVELGDEVSAWHIGDRVFGIAGGEAQAEYLLADEHHLARIPDVLDFTQAAAIPEAFMTAYDAAYSQGGLSADETLLIHAVGSGVGLSALQLAKAKGSVVIGTSRTPEKLERCREFGLDHGIVTEGSDFADEVLRVTNGRGANVILDLVGGKYFEENLKAVASKGRLLLIGLTAGRSANFDLGIALQKRATIIGTTMRARSSEEKADVTRAFIENVIPLIESGAVTPNIDRVFPATQVAAAYEYLASNESFGKVVIEF